VRGCFGFGPRECVLNPDHRQDQREDHDSHPENQQANTCPQPFGGIGRQDASDRHPHIAGEFVQPHGEPAFLGLGDVEFRGLRHRPAEALIDTQKHGRRDDPVPVRRIPDHHRDRQRHDPTPEEHPLAPDPLRPAPGDKVHHRLHRAKGHHEGGEQKERSALKPEFALGQRRDHSAGHADGETHQHDLD